MDGASMRIGVRLLSLALCFLASGCFVTGGFGKNAEELDKMPLEEARAFVADKTFRSWSNPHAVPIYTVSGYAGTIPAGHGNQVEYFGPNGRAYLWYPGNKGVVPSLWKMIKSGGLYGEITRICFLYPRRSYNPVTNESGGDWDCRRLAAQISQFNENASGDIFDLASMDIPFVLEKDNLDFDELLQKAGRSPLPEKAK